MNYYNEFDPKAAAWIQQLIDDKQIPYGYVDSRSILEVQPSDLSGFTQCHFFAGVGGWSLALQLAGWSTDRPVWTASLPCQPFSTAGKQLGTDDERHLSPTFLELVRQCNPPVLIGEQVASKLARTDWLPGIRLELEALGYSFGAADLCAPCAGEIGEGRIVRGDSESWERVIIGHPHIRQRLYWVADADSERRSGINPLLRTQEGGADGARHLSEAAGCCENGGLAQPRDIGARSLPGASSGCGGGTVDAGAASLRQTHGAAGTGGTDSRSSGSDTNDRLADTYRISELREPRSGDEGTGPCGEPLGRGLQQTGGDGAHSDLGLPDTLRGGPEMEMQSEQASCGATRIRQTDVPRNGGAPQLLPCRDGKTRRTESGIFPLVNGLSRGVVPSGDPSDPSYANATAEARAVRLKGYGNAIVPPLAAMFIKTYMEVADV